MDETRRKIEALFDEIGENCPYLLAKHLGVKVYSEDMGGIAGLYTEVVPGKNVIVINSSAHIEDQEKACFHLISHHVSHAGISLCLTQDDLKKAERSLQRHFWVNVKGFLQVAAAEKHTS